MTVSEKLGVYEFEGLIPVVDPSAFVHPTAVLIGDVIVGAGCYIGANAVLRGDFGRLTIGEGANVQDTCVLHSFPNCETIVEANGHIGHGAVLHGCRVGRNAMVGMNAVVMDHAVIGEASIVAALAFVRADMQVPPRSLVAGVPAKIIRELTEQEMAWKATGTGIYQQLAVRSRASMRQVAPLAAAEPDRKRLGAIENFVPLFMAKQATEKR
jgi:phenylacetic acid degradation protein